MAEILVLHGPNLNLLGEREISTYGDISLPEINDMLLTLADSLAHKLKIEQRNAEHELIELIHKARGNTDFILFNPAAYTHTSLVLRDALLAIAIPFIEIHLSNIFGREEFRQHSFFSDIAIDVISGFGAESYLMALHRANDYLSNGAKSWT